MTESVSVEYSQTILAIRVLRALESISMHGGILDISFQLSMNLFLSGRASSRWTCSRSGQIVPDHDSRLKEDSAEIDKPFEGQQSQG